MKKVISMLLVLTVIFASMAFASVSVNAANTADSLVAIAEGELGNTNYRKYSSYSNAWCADFVSWCARQAGVDSIPSTASCYSMYNSMIANGCQEVASPQKGDIVFFFCNSCTGTANIWCHVGIMINSSTSIDGNYSGKVSYDNSYSHYGSLGYKHSNGISKIFVRPLYGNPNNFPGEEDTSWNVPAEKTANTYLNTYNSAGVMESGHNIDVGDPCYIERVYKNGYAWVRYPTPSGDRWAYALASGFSLEKRGHNPIGVIDSIEGNTGSISLSGWAFDEDEINAQINIHVYIGGPSGDSNAEGHNQTWARTERKDVDRVYSCGAYHGFNDIIPTSKTGTQTVYVYAINAGGGNNCLIGTATVDISKDTERPTVENKYFDQVKSDSFMPCFTVKDNVGIKSVKVAVWSQSNQSDLIWYDALNNGFGTYYVVLNRADYSKENNSVYQIHAYIKDYAGNEKFAGLEMDYRIKSDTGYNIPEGEYRIVTAVNESKALDVFGAYTDDCRNIQIFSNLNNKEQTFRLQYSNNGFYNIINTHSEKLIDVAGDTYYSGTNVIQCTANGGANQEWMFRSTEDGYYNIIARSNGLALDVYGGYDKDETNVQVWDQNETYSQKWKLRRVLKDDMISVKDISIKNEAEDIIPEVTVTVDDNVIPQDNNYQVEVKSDISAGKGTVTVTGVDKYCDSITKEFNITFQPSILGDADGNEEIEIIDVTYIMRHGASVKISIPKEILMNGDVNRDGELDIVDATLIQRYLIHIPTKYKIGELAE